MQTINCAPFNRSQPIHFWEENIVANASTQCFPILFGTQLSHILDGNTFSLQKRYELAGTFCGIFQLTLWDQQRRLC